MSGAAYARPSSPSSDEALLAGFRARDPDASAAFVRRFQTRVFGLALTILGDRADAEEAAQTRSLRAWRRGGRAARLCVAIATLPAEQRRSLLLAAFLGHTARESGALRNLRSLGGARSCLLGDSHAAACRGGISGTLPVV